MSGAEPDRRWLILHCDDLGLGHCVNEAAFEAFETGCITSASVMTMCPRFSEVVRYSKRHPDFDLGVHLTLTSEWTRYRWKPVAPPERVPSLVDADGCMWPDAEALMRHARPEEVKLELRWQIEAVLDAGVVPTHLDSHMLVLLRHPRLFSIYAGLGARYSLPILVPFRSGTDPGAIQRNRRAIPVDRYFAATTSWEPERWLDHYVECFDRFVPGVNQIAVHLARHDDEMMAIQAGHETEGWTGAWRQRDLDVIRSDAFQTTIGRANVTLTTWRDVARQQ
jgi:chitin disaccharide deacetylase